MAHYCLGIRTEQNTMTAVEDAMHTTIKYFEQNYNRLSELIESTKRRALAQAILICILAQVINRNVCECFQTGVLD